MVETMLAVLVLSLMIWTCSGLWQAAQSADREADMLFHLSREAANTMEAWYLEAPYIAGTTTRQWQWRQLRVTETKTIVAEAGLWKLTLTYRWQERGRTHEQIWATLRGQ